MQDIVAERAHGCEVWDTKGKRYLDFTSGIGVTSTGHCHPRVVAAIQDQASKIIFAQQNILPATPAMGELIQRLKGIIPYPMTKFFFCNSGSEAIDNAMKLARAFTGRQNIISFTGAYHGRTYGAMSVTSSKNVYRQFFGPLPAGVVVARYPYCLPCKTREAAGGLEHGVEPRIPPLGPSYQSLKCCWDISELEMLLKMQSHPKETAAVLIEPILGEGGFLVPPPNFLADLRELCDHYGIVLIFDEVQSGAGRTGNWWAHQELSSARPDMMVFAKGIASGFPFAGLAARPHLFDGLDSGTMGGTYGGSALGCAAASATIDVIEEEGLLDNAKTRGMQLMKGLVELSARLPIAEVRGRGLMVAAELKEGHPGLAAKVITSAAQKGLLILTAGARETVRFLPPLVVNEQQVDEALSAFESAFHEGLGA